MRGAVLGAVIAWLNAKIWFALGRRLQRTTVAKGGTRFARSSALFGFKILALFAACAWCLDQGKLGEQTMHRIGFSLGISTLVLGLIATAGWMHYRRAF